MLFLFSTQPSGAPEGGPGIGVGIVLFLGILATAAAFALKWASARQSILAACLITVVMAYPFAITVVSTLSDRANDRERAARIARNGDFLDPALQRLAALIAIGDAPRLSAALNGSEPPSGVDAAGHSLIAYAAFRTKNRGGNPECLRALLATGIDANANRMPDGEPLLVYLASNPDAVKILLEFHADPNAVNPAGSDTALSAAQGNLASMQALVAAGANVDQPGSAGPPVVRLVANQQWDAALFLIESGAKLDATTPDGYSLDYYLTEWKDSIFRSPIPEGWDRVRTAIAKRRAPHAVAGLAPKHAN